MGLAGLTMDLLVEAGFHEGAEGNTPGRHRVDGRDLDRGPGSPAVELVASQFGEAVDVVRRRTPTPGVLVVVGDGFEDLVAGRAGRSRRERRAVCGPPRRPR